MFRTVLLFLGTIAVWPFVTANADCTVGSPTAMVRNASAKQVHSRSASFLITGDALPWPVVTRNGQRLRVVKYCYANEVARHALHCSVMDAFTVWGTRLGFPAGAQSGHSIAWEESHNGNPDPAQRVYQYCFNNFQGDLLDESVTWNRMVDPDTLVIYFEPDRYPDSGETKIGYDASTSIAARHTMHLGPDPTVPLIVHELGHAFGMEHEHVRSDRDEHLFFQCKNVVGYDKALEDAKPDGASDAATRLCEDWDFAQKYNFVGSRFVKNSLGRTYDEPGGFDILSVMLYRSGVGSQPYCYVDKTACALLYLVKVDGKTIGMEKIPHNKVPSDGDVAWVKKWYPVE